MPFEITELKLFVASWTSLDVVVDRFLQRRLQTVRTHAFHQRKRPKLFELVAIVNSRALMHLSEAVFAFRLSLVRGHFAWNRSSGSVNSA